VSTEQAEAPVSEQHRIATGTIAIQASRIVSLLSLVGVATVIGRTYSLSKFGVYGLTLSFAGYVLFVQGSIESAAVREIARSHTQEERDRAFTTTVFAYVAVGALAALVIAGLGNAILGVFDVPHELSHEARLGMAGLALVTFVGWPLTVFQNVNHATQRFALAAVIDTIAYTVFAALMLVLVLALEAPLWIVITVGGSIPLITGLVALRPFLRQALRFRVRRETTSRAYVRHYVSFSGAVFLSAVTDIVIYSIDRTVLAAFRSVATVGLYEAAVRPQQVIRMLQGTLVVTVLPSSSRYVAEGDHSRLREMLLRGTRYVLAATLPITVTFMVLSHEIIEVWLGSRYTPAATALTIFVGSWLLGANLGVAGSMLWAAGRTRAQVTYSWLVAAVNLSLSIWFTSMWGLNGVVIGTTAAYAVGFPLFMYYVLDAFPVGLRAFAREVWLPAYSTAALLAVALIALNRLVDLSPAPVLLVTGALAALAYWAAFYFVWLRPDERLFFRNLARGFLGRR